VQHTTAVTMRYPVDYLLDNIFCFCFLKMLLHFDSLKQVAASRIFHYHKEVFWAFKDFKESYYVRVTYLLKNIYFLKHFPLLEIVFHIVFINGFDSYMLAGELVNAKGYLTKCSFANQL
jgi:hypothetical protein